MAKRLVLAGGGHAHMTVLLKLGDYLDKGHFVTLISPSPYHYYSGMGPGMLSGIYEPQEVRFHVKKMVENAGAEFIESKVVRIDAERRILLLENGGEVHYDVASFNTGSDVSTGSMGSPQHRVIPVKPVVNLCKARHAVVQELKNGAARIVVVGGGPAGVETAANAWRLLHDRGGDGEISLVAGSRVLGSEPAEVRRSALASLKSRGIQVFEGVRVQELSNGQARLSNGRELPYDFAFIATGVRPSPLFRESGLPVGDDGGLLVNDYLQGIAHPELFGGGDCISLAGFRLARVGVYAVRQNPLLHRNLLAALEGGSMQRFSHKGNYMLIMNMGNGKGILWKNRFVWHGRLSFILKDYIDRRFMGRFQVSGELADLPHLCV